MSRLSATAGVLALGAGLAASVAFGGSADAKPTSHTIHLNGSTLKTVKLDAQDFVTTGVLRHRHLGKVGDRAGVSTFTCTSKDKGDTTFQCQGSLALKGGELFDEVTVSFTKETLKGTITGGSGIYDGAVGTLRSETRNSHSILTATFTS